MKKAIFITVIFISFINCKSTLNNKEEIITGDWLQETRSNDKIEWRFSKEGVVDLYYNNINTSSFYYSIIEGECPEKCKKYKSKWKIDNYLYLKNISDSTSVKCYEILFEENKDLSIRDLALEKDTYEILKRKN